MSGNFFLLGAYSEERAEKRVKRLDKKRRKQLPLFEPIIDDIEPLPTVHDEFNRWQLNSEFVACKFLSLDREMWRRGDNLRSIVSDLISQEELYKLDDRFRIYPRNGVNWVDYWRHILMKISIFKIIRRAGEMV